VMMLSDLTGKIVSSRVVAEGDEVTFISVNGIILRTEVDVISQQSRHSRGVRVMDLKKGDLIASVAIVRENYLSRVNDQDESNSEEGEKGAELEGTASGDPGSSEDDADATGTAKYDGDGVQESTP
jgi:DNA gyrase subunit A